jgi:hypothetical protein
MDKVGLADCQSATQQVVNLRYLAAAGAGATRVKSFASSR